MRVLLVDDEIETLSLLGLLLHQYGYETIQIRDGLEAWQALQEAHEAGDQVQLVITDWMMPGLEGPHLIKKIREANFSGYTYIILMTARASRKDMVEGIRAGADDYLVKPYDPDEVVARISIAERILNLEKMLVEQKKQLVVMATYDEMTGLLNRRKLTEIALIELARARRQDKPIGMIMIDIDHFKSVNDCYGHEVGDAALRLIANTVKSHLRPYDQAGRWGGEEFLLLLPGASIGDAVIIAERLRVSLSGTPLVISDQTTIKLSASFGVVSTNQFSFTTFDELVRLADNALYKAKNNGRNRVEKALSG